METTGRFELPLIMPNQAQKHVTHNEALTLLDGICHLVIKSFGETAPPVMAAIDDAFVVGPSATGAWFGEDAKIALNTDVGWRFVAARQGMIAVNALTSKLVIFDQAAWKSLGSMVDIATTLQLGINTSADAANRFAVRSNAALLTAISAGEGGNGDVQLKLNKELASDTASLLFQNSYAGRAEMGLAGDDDFRIKVSPDGSIWSDALMINRTTGITTLSNNSIENAALADMPTSHFKARIAVGTGDPQDITPTQATSLLDTFSTSSKGLSPASGGGIENFLRADGTWAPPTSNGGQASSWGSITGVLSAQIDLQTALNTKEGLITSGTAAQYLRGDKTLGVLNKSQVGLGNVDNISDANKPISSDVATALAGKASLTGAVFSGDVTGTTGSFSTSLTSAGYVSSKDLFNDAPNATTNSRIYLRNHLSQNKAFILWDYANDGISLFLSGQLASSLNQRAVDGAWRIGTSKLVHETSAPVSGIYRFYAFEDFMNAVASPEFAFTTSGAGTAHTLLAFPDANAIGAVQGTLGTVATNRISVASPSMSGFRLGQGVAKFASKLRLASLSDATNTWVLRNGFIDSVFVETVDGVFFRYTNGVNAGKFEAVTRNNNVETVLDTLVTAAANTTYKFEIEINGAGTNAVFKINGAIVANSATNIPTGAGRETGYGIYAQRTLGTAAVNCYLVDYLMIDLALTTSR